MLTLPEPDATDDACHAYAVKSSELLQPYLAEFLIERLGYAPGCVHRSNACA
jgi:hypothetical protein